MATKAELIGNGRSFGIVTVAIDERPLRGKITGVLTGPGLDHPEFDLFHPYSLQMLEKRRAITIHNNQGSPARFTSPAFEWV